MLLFRARRGKNASSCVKGMGSLLTFRYYTFLQRILPSDVADLIHWSSETIPNNCNYKRETKVMKRHFAHKRSIHVHSFGLIKKFQDFTKSPSASATNISQGYFDFFNRGKFLTGSFHSEIDLTRRSNIPLKIIKLSSLHSQSLPLIFYDGLELHPVPYVRVTDLSE